MVGLEDLIIKPDLLVVEPWDEEGETPSGLWAGHTWEKEAGHAFARVLAKARTTTNPGWQKPLDEIRMGEVVMFTRAAYIKADILVWGKETSVLFVNIEDIIAQLPGVGEHDAKQDSLDTGFAGANSDTGARDSEVSQQST